MALGVKDSRWLQLEVCRENQRNKCTRQDTECKFAHPPPYVEVQNGRVIACYDSIKGRCNREKPPCKYFHPPQHLKDQLLINGRNHLALKNAILQQLPLLQPPPTPHIAVGSPYLPALAAQQFSPYLSPGALIPASMMTADPMSIPQIMHTPMVTQKIPRTDRLEVCREYQRGNCKRPEVECRFAHPPDHVTVDSAEGVVTVCMDYVKGRCSRDLCRYFHPTPHLQAQLKATQNRANAAMAYPGASPCNKRIDKSGIPMYQPTTAHQYQQAFAMQVQQQPFVPVSLPAQYCLRPTEFSSPGPPHCPYVLYLPSPCCEWPSANCCPQILDIEANFTLGEYQNRFQRSSL